MPLSPEEFEAVYAKERYLIAREWYRAPENGPGFWQKYDPWGSMIMSLDAAFDYQVSLDEPN